MATLSIHNFFDLSKEQQKSIISELGENFDPAYFAGDDLNNVNAEVVTDEDGTLYDVRVFDPFHNVEGDTYIGPDGWSNWLLDYTDPAGNDVDEIIENYDGETQSASYDFPDYVTPDEEYDTYFYVYFSDMEKYWVEEYGQESWDNASFEDIDKEIQTNNPELWYAGNGSNDRGKYLAYTTDESQTYK